MLRPNLIQFALLATLIPLNLHADETTDTIKAQLQKSSPNLNIKSIQPSRIPGLYEVYAGGSILYVDKSASYVLANGALFELATRRNLTEDRLQSLSAIQFDTLPFKDAIEIRKGSGAYRFAVFTDPDCPYCQGLEKGLEKMGITDYTAYVFLMPLESLHKDARWKAEAVWCAPDRAAAWHDLMIKGKLPEKATCPNPIDSVRKLADTLGVAATPTIYLNTGKRSPGPQELVDAIRQSQKPQANNAGPATGGSGQEAL